MKYFFSFVGVLILIVITSLVLRIVFFPIHTAGNLINTAYDAQDKTINADNAIYNYEWFKQQKQDIDATAQKLTVAQKAVDNFVVLAGERDKWTFEDKQEYGRLSSVAQGTENYLIQQITDYNARASMANRNIFEDSILPSYIDSLTFFTK